MSSGDVKEIKFTDEEIENARVDRQIFREQQYERQRRQDIEGEQRYRKKEKKFALLVFLPLGAIGIVGIILVAVGAGLDSTAIMTAGGIITGVGFVPFMIVLIIYAWVKGIPIWW